MPAIEIGSGTHSFPAPAKLKLMLRVVGCRPDGYHLLQTVFRFIDHGDTITFRVRDDGGVTRTNDVPGVAADADLTVRAARLLQAAAGTPLGADIAVEKRLPLGGGLGGGSSDAATALIALNHLWGTRLGRERLLALALELGADVPAFVFGENAWAEGIGEQLTPLSLPDAWYLVLTPPVEVPTTRIFHHPQLKRDSKPIKIQAFFSAEQAGNDLEATVCGEFPEVGRHLAWLRRSAPAWVTGSGSSVFAAFSTENAAREVWAQAPEGMRGFIAQGLSRHPLRDLV